MHAEPKSPGPGWCDGIRRIIHEPVRYHTGAKQDFSAVGRQIGEDVHNRAFRRSGQTGGASAVILKTAIQMPVLSVSIVDELGVIKNIVHFYRLKGLINAGLPVSTTSVPACSAAVIWFEAA